MCTEMFGYQEVYGMSECRVKVICAALALAFISCGCSNQSGGGSVSGNSAVSDDSSTSGTDAADESDFKKSVISSMESEASENGNAIELELWCSDDDAYFEKTLVEEFCKEYASDKYEINIRVKSDYGEDKAGGKLLESPKEAADVFNFADDQLPELVKANAVAKVESLFRDSVSEVNTSQSVEVCSVNGDIYAFPKTADNGYLIFYNKRVFEDDEVGCLDDMIKKANESGKSVYMNVTNPWYMTSFFFTAGCKLSYDIDADKQTADLNTPEGLNAAKAVCHLAESEGEGFVGTFGSLGDDANMHPDFGSDEFAAAIIGTWAVPTIKEAVGEENFGAAKLPTVLIDGKQEQLHSFCGYKAVGVNANTKFPISAQALAYYLTNKESQLKRYNERNGIPTNNEVLEDDSIKNDPVVKAVSEQAAYAHPQGTTVENNYWSATPETVGIEAIDKKGSLSDEELNKILGDIAAEIS